MKWRMFYPTMPMGRHEVVGLNDHEGLWSKKEEFWRNKQNGDFPGKTFLKRDFLPFSTNIYFRGKRFKRDFLKKNRFMGKGSESLLFF